MSDSHSDAQVLGARRVPSSGLNDEKIFLLHAR